MIELKNMSFSYEGGGKCIRDMSLCIEDNECVVLMGCSGSGKTTLTRIINGLAPSYYVGKFSGEVIVNGKQVQDLPQWERARCIGSVFQDPKSQFFSGELAGEVAFACENFGFSTEEIRSRTNSTITEMSIDYLRSTPIDRFSSGEKQKTAIASVRLPAPDIYVFDEPSANLDEEATVQLSQSLAELKAQGNTLIIAEHRLCYLMEVADRFIYLQHGRLCGSYTRTELLALSDEERVQMGIRSPKRIDCPLLPATDHTDNQNPSMVLRQISYSIKRKSILSEITLTVYPCQIVAVTGRNGAGKTTLAKIMCGLIRETEGRILLEGKSVKPSHRCRMVWYGSNDTNTQFFTENIAAEVMLLSEKTPEQIERARKILRMFELYEYKDRHPATLSGGQKQRLSIACGLLCDRSILVFDEPTSGLDAKNMRLVSSALKYAAAQGKTILVITHDNELVSTCCTHLFRTIC